MEDGRLGFLIKLQCLFHLGPYFLTVAFLNHVLCLCGLETSLLTPHTSPPGLRLQTGPHEVPVVVQLQHGSFLIEVHAFLRWPAFSPDLGIHPGSLLELWGGAGILRWNWGAGWLLVWGSCPVFTP